VLARLLGAASATRTVGEIRESLAADHHRPKLSDLIDRATGRIRPIVWTGIGLAVFQQLVGINVVFYYGATLWQAVGFSESYALQTNILSGVVSIAGCLATLLLVDRVGRKPLLLIGSAGMAVTLGIVAWAFSTAVHGADGGVTLPGSNGVIALFAANAYRGVQHELGPDHVGHARRNVPQPDPWLGPGGVRLCPVDRQCGDFGQLPGAGGFAGAGDHLFVLCRRSGGVVRLRARHGQGNQGRYP
jgi:MFS family permease